MSDMPDIQDKLNQILSNPEALKQVQSLGEQLGLSANQKTNEKAKENASTVTAPAPAPSLPQISNAFSPDMLNAVTRLAPLMNSFKGDDDTTRLLHSLRPFLSLERQTKLDKAEKMLKLIRLMPLLKDNGLF